MDLELNEFCIMNDVRILDFFFFWKLTSLGEIFILHFFLHNYTVIKLKKIDFHNKNIIGNMYRAMREAGFILV